VGVLLVVHDLAHQWRYGDEMIISGFHSPVEQEAFTVLLRGPARVIQAPARSLARMRLDRARREALDAGRLLLISPFAENVRRSTKKTAAYRNRLVAALADEIIVAHAQPGSASWLLAEEVLGWGKPVYTLDHLANDGLLTLGAQQYRQ
jgi:predicted Rossmann fold nucleotide-binding protein DprA/Smf involved in DNA uptake